MTLYVIRGDNVTEHSSAPAIVSQGELMVQSIGDIEASGSSDAPLQRRHKLPCRKASELGAFEFLTKPVDFDRLKAQLRRLAAPTGSSPVPGATARGL